jgi:lysophospholipase L1-like esterase
MRFKRFIPFAGVLYFCIAAFLLLSCTKKYPAKLIPPVTPDTVKTTGSKTYLALGDSYTIGQSVPSSQRFPVQLVSLLRSAGYQMTEPEIIATTGWSTGNLIEAIKGITPGKKFDAVSLLIGVNNQYQGRSLEEYRSEFTALVNKSIQFAGNDPAKVVVISIPDYSVTPYAQYADTKLIATQIDEFNRVNKQISDLYKVNYIDVTGESRKAAADPSLIAADGLHFSGKEYAVWVDLMLPVFKNMLR